MLSLAVNGYSHEAVARKLHAQAGSRQVRFRYELLNRYDIKIGELAVDTGGVVSQNSLAEIKRTAKFTIKETDARQVDWLNDRVRPVFMLQMPDGGFAEWSLGIFLLSSPVRTGIGKNIRREVEAYDASLIIAEDRFDNRYRILPGTMYVDAVTDLLNSAGIRKVNIAAHPGMIGIDKEFETGTRKLDAVNQLLTELNYTSLWVDENGYFTAKPYIIPSGREAEYAYRDDQLSIIHPGAVVEEDLFSVPNKWVRVASNPEKAPVVSRYTNDLPASRTSTYSRGRMIVDFQKVDDILDQATLDGYTRRIAYEASQIYGKFIFNTALMPHHSFSECLFIRHSNLEVSAKYMETAWSMELANGGRMTHECRRVIQI